MTAVSKVDPGLFGSVQSTPLISRLLDPALLDALIRGFAAKHQSVFTGIVQNDGTVFPSKIAERDRLFCNFCLVIRNSQLGEKACKASDCFGVEQLFKSETAGDRKSPLEVLRYTCHAGNIEILAPLQIHFGVPMSPSTVGGFWAGQIRVNCGDQAENQLHNLGVRLEVPLLDLKQSFESGRECLTDSQIEEIEASLLEWSSATSKTISDAYGAQQNRLALDMQLEFQSALTAGMHKAARQVKFRAREDVLAGFLKPAFERIQSVYGLARLQVIRCNSAENTITDWIDGTKITDRRILPALLLEQLLPYPLPTVASSDVFESNQGQVLLKKLGARSTSTALFARQIGHKVGFIFVAEENSQAPWYIREDEIQSGLGNLLTSIAQSLVSECETLRVLETTSVEVSRLTVERQRTKKLVLQMAHLVSRPLGQLQMATDGFMQDPTKARLNMYSCLAELRRAVSAFKSFERLSEGERRSVNLNRQCDVAEVFRQAQDNIKAILELERRSVDWIIGSRSGTSVARIDRDVCLEIAENLLHNAIKYSFGGRSILVEFLPYESAGEVVVRVTNYGCQVSANEFEKIFLLEYRSPHASSYQVEGSGIGLWITRELVKMYKGTVRILSSVEVDSVQVRRRHRARFKNTFELRLISGNARKAI